MKKWTFGELMHLLHIPKALLRATQYFQKVSKLFYFDKFFTYTHYFWKLLTPVTPLTHGILTPLPDMG